MCVCVRLHMCVCVYVTDACNSVFLLILSRTCQTVTETHSGDISSLAQDIYNEIKYFTLIFSKHTHKLPLTT